MAAFPGLKAQDHRLPVVIEKGARDHFESSADLVSDDDVVVIFTQLIYVIHVAKGSLPEGPHEEARGVAPGRPKGAQYRR